MGGGDQGRGCGERQDRHAEPGDQPALGRRAARPGLPAGLWHRPGRSGPMGRRNRPAHRRPRGDRRQRRGWPESDGGAAGQGSRHQRGLHHQRTFRRRRL